MHSEVPGPDGFPNFPRSRNTARRFESAQGKQGTPFKNSPYGLSSVGRHLQDHVNLGAVIELAERLVIALRALVLGVNLVVNRRR